MSASYRREGRGRVERFGDAAERPDLPRVAHRPGHRAEGTACGTRRREGGDDGRSQTG